MRKIVLISIIILIGLGFVPYKFPADINKMTSEQILVVPQESTCATSLRVVKGELIVPDNLKSLIKNYTDLSTTGDNTPSTHIDNGDGNVVLYLNNSYILSGKVVGYDTTFYKDCDEYSALYKVSGWSPTEYNANLWTFSRPFLILYFLSLFGLIITGIILFVNKSRQTNRQAK
jgi:hypothetical protein